MDEDVKGRTTRISRAHQAVATRRRIVEAAGRFFIRDGYAATTLQQIADEAGVAVQTVYFHFGNKRTLLKELVDVASVGDDQPVALLDRPWVQELHTAPGGAETVAVWLRTSCEIFGRVTPVLRIVRDAAGSDPEMAAQWEINQQQRHTAHRALAEVLDAKGALRPGLTVDEAADILFALISLEIYVLLTVERGWAPEQWERWAGRTVSDAVLAQPGPAD
ncbi:TetR family transcriptional regulator [Blastococcus colisei]|uniref:TetR family transcriptional regulator n=1 Tax=Blastococcus colisei TaxID=1564162 RepID=A0A543PHQ7_9ACTN|nr:TetR/AcrR family transcriptional regulator [Blastococcus colisei]TQN43608.1 TetR family transcriptional regulator [Blastococcus colisei]